MYAMQLGPVVYDARRDGTPLTLVECYREVIGTGEARILRLDDREDVWRVVMERAGSAHGAEHVPSGRFIRRGRPACHLPTRVAA